MKSTNQDLIRHKCFQHIFVDEATHVLKRCHIISKAVVQDFFHQPKVRTRDKYPNLPTYVFSVDCYRYHCKNRKASYIYVYNIILPFFTPRPLQAKSLVEPQLESILVLQEFKKPPIILTNVFPDRFLRSKSSKAIYMWLATTSDLQMKLMFSISPLCSLCLLARYQMKEGPHHRTPAQHLRRWCHEIDDAVLPYALQRAWPPKWRELGQKGLVGAVGASR